MNDPVFLTYIPRSGSTLLARMLSDVKGVEVTLEADFPDGLLRPELVLNTDEEVPAGVQNLLGDRKFSAWSFSRSDLKDRLTGLQKPAGYSEWLPAVLASVFGTAPRLIVVKYGDYIMHVERLRRLFPGCRFLHVMRDPRGVYASQRRSLDSQSSTPMVRSPFTIARYFNKVAQQVLASENEPFFCLVKYEDLVVQPGRELQRIKDFVGVGGEEVSLNEKYAADIPREQKHLHPDVAKAPDPSRIDAWKEELSRRDMYLIQDVCRPYLQTFGYEILPQSERPGRYYRRYIRAEISSLTERILRRLS